MIEPRGSGVADFNVPGAVAAGALLLSCLSIVLFGIYLQSQVHINHDVAWIAHSASWLLDGKRFGTDILDPNPPMAWFLMLPVAAAVRAGWLSEITGIQVWSWLLSCAGLTLTFRILLPMAVRLGRFEVGSLLIAATAVTSILPIGNFGQRDVIAFTMILPYLSALIGRLHDLPATNRGLLMLVGLGTGLGVCLKPYLLVVPFAAEVLHVALNRNLRVVLRTEIVAMIVVGAAYLISIWVFAPDYLANALPLARAVYWSYNDSGYLILDRFKDAIWPAGYAVAFAIASLSFNRVHATLLAAVGGFSISYWVQQKGFPYHAYPVLGASCMLLVYATVRAIRTFLRRFWNTRRPVGYLLAGIVLVVALPVLREPFENAFYWYESADPEGGRFGQMRQSPIERIRALGIEPTDYLYALSTHPHPGFPTVNYLGVRWAGTAATQFVIPAHVRRAEITDAAVLTQIDRATEQQVEQVISDLSRHKPRYVMVEARQRRLGLAYRPFDDIAFYSRRPAFAQVWKCYAEVETVEQIRLFELRADCREG